MRLFCLLLILLGMLEARSARAQVRPVSDSLALAAPAAPDTLAALHHLFAHKRAVRNRVLAGTLLGGGGLVALVVASNAGPGSQAYTALAAIAAGGIILPATMLGELLFYNANYGRRRERRAIEAARTHRLGAELRNKLTPAHFRPPTTP